MSASPFGAASVRSRAWRRTSRSTSAPIAWPPASSTRPARCVVRDRVATPQRDVWPALHRLVRRVVAARPDDVDPLGGLRGQLRGPDRRRRRHGVAVAPAGVAALRAARADRRADRPADRARADRAGPRARRALEGRGRRRHRRDGAARVRRRRGRDHLQRPPAARPPRQRRPARPRRRRARRPGVRVRWRRLPDGLRVVVGDRGGDEPAAAAGAGLGHRAGRA